MKTALLKTLGKEGRTMTQQLVKWAELRNKEGETQWTVWLNPSETKTPNSAIKESQPQGDETKKPKEGSGENHDPMTDAQKRYLFRLLADQGIEGDEAYQHLKKTFGVEYLRDVGKIEASRVIDQLLKGGQEVKHGSESAFP
jgi:hypothetical protein